MKYPWVDDLAHFLKQCAYNTAYFIAACVCFFRGHDYQKYTLTVCDRCMRIK